MNFSCKTFCILFFLSILSAYSLEEKVPVGEHHQELSALIALDIKIENQVKSIVDLTTKYKDSSSGSHLIRNKEKLIRALKNSVKSYKKNRDDLFRDQKNRRILDETTYRKLMTYLDKKFDLRIQQLVEVSGSLTTYREYYGDHRHNNNSKAKRASKDKARLVKDMKSSIKKLEKEAEVFERQLDSKFQKKSHDLITEELRSRYKKMELLEHSILDIINNRSGGVHAVDKRMVTLIDKQLRERVSDLRIDIRLFEKQATRLFRKVKK